MVQLPSTPSTRAQTPPSHPIYGVHLSDVEIQAIISSNFPNSTLVSFEQLPRGQSFNNRIYFINLRCNGSQDDLAIEGSERGEEFVLKVNGRFFGADKVQNEAGVLWLLEKYCPEIPSPRLFAWSEDGDTIVSVSEDRRTASKTRLHLSCGTKTVRPGWILMSKAKGERLADLDLQPSEWATIGAQVAELASTWRRKIPTQAQCGGISFEKHPNPRVTLPAGPDPDLPYLNITGIVGDGIHFANPVTDTIEFFNVKLNDKLRQLESNPTYALNKSSLSPPIRDFISTTLPELTLIRSPTGTGNDGFFFTHYDLSPRNVLVSKTEPGYSITGLVDFEFAGFFPALEEFVNDYVDNGGDWEKEAYDAYLRRLSELGVPTPAEGIDKQVWEQAHWLGELLENLAPWWLPGDRNDTDLEKALMESKQIVLDTLELLKSQVKKSS